MGTLSRHKRALPERDLGRGDPVTGARCVDGHVNAPGRVFCLACGAEMWARGGSVGEGPRPVVGALVRGDGVRLPVATEVALQACAMMPAADGSHAPIRARIVFLGWDPHALAETVGIAWIDSAGAAQVLEPGESVLLRPQGRLVLGLDVFCWEPMDVVEAPRRPGSGRRRRRLPDRSLFN